VKMSAMNELINLVRQRIDSKSVTITCLAAQVGISRAHIYKLLAGESEPTLPLAERLATALGADLSLTVHKTRSNKKTSEKIPA
jgi:DNA-binding phage protein